MAGKLIAIQARNVSGPVAGAKFNTFLAGTTTRTPVYADEALTTPLANPVTANAHGVIGCWADTTVPLKIQMTDSAGSTNLFRVLDNYDPAVDDILYLLGNDIESARADALDAAAAALASQTAAAASASAASTSATAAATSATNASTSASAASTSATNASNSASSASTSATDAATSATNAASSATTATTQATNAANSAAAAAADTLEVAAWADGDVDEPVENVTGDIVTWNPQTAVDTGANTITIAANTFENYDALTYRTNGGTAPSPLVNDTQYWVIDKDVGGAGKFKLSATRGGAAIDLTTTGAGTTHQFLPLRSSKHREYYARQSQINALASEIVATTAEARISAVYLGEYANASAASADPYFALHALYYNTTDAIMHRVTDTSPPASETISGITASEQSALDDLVNGILPAGATVTATGSSSARSLESRFAEVTNVKDFGAVGDGSTNDTAALQAAFTYAASNGKRLYFPRGTYLHTTTIGTITASDWFIFGLDASGTILQCSGDTDSFKIDVSAAYLFRNNFSGLEFLNTHATGLNSTGIRVVATTASVTGLRHSTFHKLRFRGVGYGIYLEDTGKVDDGAGNISVGVHGYNNFIDLEFPQYTRYPLGCVKFEATNGVQNRFHGGQYRADATSGYGIDMGTGGTDVTIGDMTVVGVAFNVGKAAFRFLGPSNNCYRSSILVTGCQFDVMTSYSYHIERLERVRIFNNNQFISQYANIVNCDLSRSIVETRDEIWMYGSRFVHVANTVNEIVLTPSATGGASSITVGGASVDTNTSLSLGGKGTGGILMPSHRANKWFIGGGDDNTGGITSGASLVTMAPVGTDTDIDARFGSKGTSALILQDSASRTLGFFNSAGQAKATISADTLGNPAVQSLLTELADHGLITNSSTTTQANRIIVDANLGSTHTTTGSSAENVITASAAIPADGAYLVTAALNVRHRDSAASTYSMRVMDNVTLVDVHAYFTAILELHDDDYQLFCSRVLWLTSGTRDFKVQIVQNPWTTAGAQIFANSTSARAAFLQIVRL